MIVSAGAVADLPDDRCTGIAGGAAVVVRVGTEVAAFPNRCLHQDSPLADGWVRDGVLTCPLHFWRYRTDDGALVGGGVGDRLDRLAVSIVDGEALVDVPEPPPAVSMRDRLLVRAAEYDRADAHRAHLARAGGSDRHDDRDHHEDRHELEHDENQ